VIDDAATPTLRSELRRGVNAYNLSVAFGTSLVIAAIELALSRFGVVPLIVTSHLGQALTIGISLFLIISMMHIAAHAYFGWRFERGVAALSSGSVTRAMQLLGIAERPGMDHYDEEGAVRRLLQKIRSGEITSSALPAAPGQKPPSR
jgi:hypothetical protein